MKARYYAKRDPIEQPADTSIRHIALTHGQVAVVDAIDYPWLNLYNWFADWNKATQSWYARRNVSIAPGKQIRVSMHRVILGLSYKDGKEGDHKNCNTLDYRRDNLRLADDYGQTQNQRKQKNNTSGIKGVSLHKQSGLWVAHYRENGRTILKYFTLKEDAVSCRREAAERLYGDFARHE